MVIIKISKKEKGRSSMKISNVTKFVLEQKETKSRKNRNIEVQ